MKKLVMFVMPMLLGLTLFAQRDKDIPAFGKVDKADLEMKSCDFDKDAEAVVLFDVAELYFDFTADLEISMERHVRIKILKDKGLMRADIHIPFHSYRNDESIKSLSAQTYNLDASGNVVATKVDKKLIYEKKLNKRFSEEVFTFPEAKAGSIIEYKYTHTNIGLTNWIFQKSIPVKYSRFRINSPNELEVFSQPMCVLPFESKRESKGNRDIKLFSMTNVPALRDEPYISCEDDYLQRIESRIIAYNSPLRRISYVYNWVQIVKGLMEDEDFGVQLKRDIPRTTDLDAALKSLTDPHQKMETIYKYVQKNMEWDGSTSIWALDGVRSAWKEKKGTIGEINLILVNLLRDAGLAARPMLVSTRDNGRVNTSVATIRQFNKVLAHVTIGDRVYVLDATEKYMPARLIPLDVMTTEVLLIEKLETGEWGWRTLWDDKPLFKEVVLLQSTINEDGVMKGDAIVNSFDYSRVQRMPDLKKGKDKFLEKYFTAANPGSQSDSLVIENENNDSLPLVQRLKFSMPVSSSGNYKYFSVNLFTGLEKNPFVVDNRFSDVFFGANQQYNIVANVQIPKGYVFEALPKNVRMIMPDTSISITRRLAAEKDILSVRISLEFKKPFYLVDEYPDFKEFYKKLFDLLNEQIAIRKES
jgi:hypothetical protein